jgi:predicted RNA-binding Zn ribbon-like protein
MSFVDVDLDRIGGALALDFVNTVGFRGRDAPVEHLRSFHDFLLWSASAGTLERSALPRLSKRSRERPSGSLDLLERARTLREALYRLFRSRMGSVRPRPRDVATLNAWLAHAPERRGVRVVNGSFQWKVPHGRELERLLWPIAWSAADVLVTTAPERLKVCAGEGCGWLFVDVSRNLSRRWCSMSDCGNRAKARRHYDRARRERPKARLKRGRGRA